MPFNPRLTARVLVIALLLAGGLSFFWLSPRTPTWLPDELREEATRAFRLTYQREPDPLDILSFAAELAVQREQLDLANQCFGEIPTSHPLYGHSARLQQGQVLLKLNRAQAAEANLQEYLALPEVEYRDQATQFLRYLLEIQLRFEERNALLTSIHTQGKLKPADALFLGYASLLRWNGEQAVDRCRQFYEQDPDNLRLQIAWAQYLGGSARAQEGLTLIEATLAKVPDNPRAQAVKLYLLAELGEDDLLTSMMSALPPPRHNDPWLMLRVRGQAALARDDLELAEQCYQLYIDNDPSLAECHFGLAEIAGRRGQTERKKAFQETGRQLALIQNRLGGAQFSPSDPAPFLKLAEMSLAAGLKRQAQLMAESAILIDPQNSDAAEILTKCQP